MLELNAWDLFYHTLHLHKRKQNIFRALINDFLKSLSFD